LPSIERHQQQWEGARYQNAQEVRYENFEIRGICSFRCFRDASLSSNGERAVQYLHNFTNAEHAIPSVRWGPGYLDGYRRKLWEWPGLPIQSGKHE